MANRWVIYKIVNAINGKGYIGITTKCLDDRLEEHINDAYSRFNRRYPLHAAIEKYGRENFSIEELDWAYDLHEAQKLERRYIRELKTYASGPIRGGYNLTHGGEEPDWDLTLDVTN